MIKVISMCGSSESLRRLREAFRTEGIDLEDRDYLLEEDIIEALQINSDITAILIVERMTSGLEDGKYGLIEHIRAVDETVRIIFCGNSDKRDSEYENWCYKHSVYDFVYPKNSNYDTGAIIKHIKKGRFKPGEAEQIEMQTDKKSGYINRKNGFMRKIGIPFLKRNKPKPMPPKPSYLPPEDIERMAQEHLESLEIEEVFFEEVTVNAVPEAETPVVEAIEAETLTETKQISEPEETAADTPMEAIEERPVIPKQQPKEVLPEAPSKIPPEKPSILCVEENTIKGTFCIAVFNLSRGAGATTMAYCLSETLRRAGANTTLLIADNKNDLKHIYSNMDISVPYGYEEVVYMAQNLAVSNYQYLVIDFGTLFTLSPKGECIEDNLTVKKGLFNEFFRCHLHIGMGFSAPWHIGKLKAFTPDGTFFSRLGHGTYIYILDGEAKRRDKHGLMVFTREQAMPERLAGNLLGIEMPHKRGKLI